MQKKTPEPAKKGIKRIKTAKTLLSTTWRETFSGVAPLPRRFFKRRRAAPCISPNPLQYTAKLGIRRAGDGGSSSRGRSLNPSLPHPPAKRAWVKNQEARDNCGIPFDGERIWSPISG